MNWFLRLAWRVFGPIARFFHPIEVRGLENLPAHGALLCPNHSSAWDPIQIVISVPIDYHLHVMAKESLFKIPAVGWVVRMLGAFPVDRGHSDLKAVKTAIQVIRNGENLMIFPEGTRTDGEGQVRAKGGVAAIGIRTGATLIPVFVDGKKRLFHKTRLIFGPPYVPVYTGRHGTAEEVQAIADEVLHRAYALGREEEPPCHR
jgi:1-acyl-sn-glycerol-3-phosphate acyltransferase